MKLITEHLYFNPYKPWEDKATNVPNSPYLDLTDEQCTNVVDALDEVKFVVDADSGKVLEVTFNNGQRMHA